MTTISVTAPLWIGVPIGMCMGAVGQIWGIGNPETLIRLARWRDRLLVGCLAITCAVGAVALYGLYALGFSMHFAPKPMYVFGISIGGFLFGAGIAISGYLPGSELMALGEGRQDALYAFPGGLLGAAAWTLVYSTPVGQWLVHAADYGDLIASGPIQHIRPVFTFLIAVVYAAALLVGAALLPRYARGSSCVVRAIRGRSDPNEEAWMSDTVAYLTEGGLDQSTSTRFHTLVVTDVPTGNFYSRIKLGTSVVLGLVVVFAIFLHQIFGESTTYSWFAGHLLLPNFDYTKLVIQTVGWEPFADIGTLLGALITAVFVSRYFQGFRLVIPPSWRNRFGREPWKRAIGSFGGFFILMFGARMAGGCASGHMLSGGVQMAASGWLFTVAVFIGMTATARVIYRKASEKVSG
ncbi:MAG: YeeE/YedE thiosulfate transporter family protein [Mycobacterium sp.]|uniref:YeeE/YedE thiosulfate transporter family protein n=1 Tax=Mycobacterium sp. TaxID=1785 RepID=UPI002639E9E7|nr:YeeE/YedE thiosulfate transporter family protein [Mycobacterium sp.]MDI3315228.1 YeeE/YedE thiosulfate transporter family protein [Mycobacterium sp.]